MIDVYIITGGICIAIFAMGAILVWNVYRTRTRVPSVNADDILESLIPKPPT